MEPSIQYVTASDGVSIAYYAIGNGPPLIGLSPGLTSQIDVEWRVPRLRFAAENAARAFTYIRYDPRGCGLSSRDVTDFSVDAMLRDLEAVADKSAPGPFSIFSVGHSSAVALAYAASHPDRVERLVTWNGYARAADYRHPALDGIIALARTDWNMASESFIRAIFGWRDNELGGQMAAMMREAITPATWIAAEEQFALRDIRPLLSAVAAPTLVLHPRNHPYFTTDSAKALAAALPNGRLQIIEGDSLHLPVAELLPLLAEFFGSPVAPLNAPPELPEGTAIILFTDIVDSTAMTERIGDDAFRVMARELDAALRSAIRDSGGVAVEGKLLGDGVLGVFTSARQGIDAAIRCRNAAEATKLELHMGLHAGDVIRERDNIYGGAVNIASRVAGASQPGEILVSDTVRSLARTSANVTFEDRGEHTMKGIAEPQRLFAVVPLAG